MELTDTSREAQERQALLLRKLEAEKRKRLLVVPTNPAEVGALFVFCWRVFIYIGVEVNYLLMCVYLYVYLFVAAAADHPYQLINVRCVHIYLFIRYCCCYMFDQSTHQINHSFFPPNQTQVVASLRSLGQPITLFGETVPELLTIGTEVRRLRLRSPVK